MNSSLLPPLTGLALGCGLLLVWTACWESDAPTRARPRLLAELDDDLVAAGFPRLTPSGLAGVCAASAAVVGILAFAVTAAWTVSACFAIFAAGAPPALIRHRARSRQTEHRVLWPEAIDHLSSGVRAGMSLPEALAALAHRGPTGLQPLFEVFAAEYRATGSFALALDRFRAAAADPVADRIVAALQVTREVGGAELGTLLRTLAQFLREDARTRSELRARQSWTITGARLAVAAPWIVLALLSTRPEASSAYSTPSGAALLFGGLVVSALAYQAMKRIGRLPAEPRVLR